MRIWTLLLLGEFGANDDYAELEEPRDICQEQQVLDADVKRTRADLEIFRYKSYKLISLINHLPFKFRSATWRKAIKNILQSFCIAHDVQ